MSGALPFVPLGRFVTHRKTFIEIDDLETYNRCRVQSHARGVVLRDSLPGAEVKTKRQQICRENDLLVAEIDAKVGGYGIVPPELDGAIVSSHYFLFAINAAELNIRYLDYYLRTAQFFEQVRAKGSTNYAAIRPIDVLGYLIPLPPLDEQRRIVARIEELSGKIEAIRGLRREVSEEGNALLRSIIAQPRDTRPLTPMNELVALRPPDTRVERDEVYSFAGVYSFGRGVFPSQIRRGDETAYRMLTKLKTGDFVYPKLMAWEGALGVVPPECDGLYVSPEFPVFTPNESRVLPETLDVYFRSPAIWPLLSSGSTGTNVRRRRLHPTAFLAHEMPLPSLEVQHVLRSVIIRLQAVERALSLSKAELDRLLPSITDRVLFSRD
jgi:type I restriction enzyme, S subunit